jgi:hypothetical protein
MLAGMSRPARTLLSHPTLSGVALLLAALVLAPACQSGKATGDTASAGFPAPEQEMVYATALDVVQKHGFAIDNDYSDPDGGKLVSRWKNSLQPFSSKGWREKVTVTIRPVQGRTNSFMTETQVVRQLNKNMTDPSNILTAEWGGEERDAEMESLINRQIEVTFLPGGLSPEFRERYGLRSVPNPRIENPTARPPAGR